MKNQKGQAILILIVVMVVVLAIGLSIVQKSLVDVSTATKVEESSRAFSAAEAGIEKALKNDTSLLEFTENSSSITEITDTGPSPCIPGVPPCPQTAGQQQVALEYPPLAKEDIAQVWLADLTSPLNPPSEFYKPSDGKIELYWGNSTSDKAAVEVKIIYYGDCSSPLDGINEYCSLKKFFDPDSTRSTNNGFTYSNCSNNNPIRTILDKDNDRNFYCKEVISLLPPSNLMLLRARLLYNRTSQPFAVRGSTIVTCSTGCYLPQQARVITSTGVSGETQRKIQVLQIDKVVPPYFDYAIFSAGEIRK